VKLEVFMSPGELTPGDVQGRVVAVIDVLRASTSIAVALAKGARRILPVIDIDDSITLSKNIDKINVRRAG
jgi:2-phosphosulfolactate phosphatase